MTSLLRLFAKLSLLSILTLRAASQTQDCLGTRSSDNESATTEMSAGIDSYKAARYAEAIEHFRRATRMAPCLTMARVYLATALAQDVVPGLNNPENVKTASESIENFKLVLAQNPHDINSLKQVSAVYFSTKQFDNAREWQKKVLIEDPHDPEASYTIGVIDWTLAHQNAMSSLASVSIEDDGMGNVKAPAQVLEDIKQKNDSLVAEALQYLIQAIEDRPNYDDAMAYLNLTYRRKADIDYANSAVRDDDLAKAQEWAQKAMRTRKENEAKQQAPNSSEP